MSSDTGIVVGIVVAVLLAGIVVGFVGVVCFIVVKKRGAHTDYSVLPTNE